MDSDMMDTSTPGGTKLPTPPPAPRKIVPLSEDVVNKIAAGEIIVAPVHALKELIENAVDAGSTALEILVKDGGLKLLQISDNGHGIDKDDMAILCERFTTSKLKTFEDLSNIGTYGFRGEALASISHIAHLTVTTRTAGSSCAWRATYDGGKLAPPKPGQSAEPKAIAGKPGTQITVEDLFYNVPTRRRAFRSASEEYAKILELVGRYAVHCIGVSFSCKKHGDSGMNISVPTNASIVDRIRQVHGTAVARELIQFSISDDRWGFKAEGWASNANYSVKKTTILLFINHRAVESSAIKKAVEQMYSVFLPKGGHPFIYLSLEIEPQRVDVNVHPTKREVNFLNEDEITESITTVIQEQLGSVDTSRTFMTQTLLPTPMKGASPSTVPTIASLSKERSIDLDSPQSAISQKRKPLENALVRTDSKVRKITSMLPTTTTLPSGFKAQLTTFDTEFPYTTDETREQTVCRLTSIKELRAAIRDAMHNDLTDVLASHTFVGIVDSARRLAAIQSGIKLYLVDYGMLCNEYFYQLGLTDFGNFGTMVFDPPLGLNALLKIAAEHEAAMITSRGAEDDEEEPLDWDEVVSEVSSTILSRRDMLLEYFALDIVPTEDESDGEIRTFPLLMKGYIPCMAKLPRFLLRLGPHVDWTNEKGCFEGFLRELASFYAPEALPIEEKKVDEAVANDKGKGKAVDTDAMDVDARGTATTGGTEGGEKTVERRMALRRKQLMHALEHIIFPAFKNRLVATKGMLRGTVEVANLKGLYRVFERC